MTTITSHIVNTTTGAPARGVLVELSQNQQNMWVTLTQQTSDEHGRVTHWEESELSLTSGVYRLRFYTHPYFKKREQDSFYPYIEIVFNLSDNQWCYHIPLLISPFAYSTYKGD